MGEKSSVATKNEVPTRQRIVEAMYHLVAERGYSKASMKAIAERSGIAKATIYAHFDSKEQVFVEMMRDMDNSFDDSLAGDIDRITTAEEFRTTMLALGYSIVGTYRSDRERRLVVAEVMLETNRNEVFERYTRSNAESMMQLFKRILERGINLGVLKVDTNASDLACEMYVVMLGLSQATLHDEDLDAKGIWKRYLEHALY